MGLQVYIVTYDELGYWAIWAFGALAGSGQL